MGKKKILTASEMGRKSWEARLARNNGSTDFMSKVGQANKGIKKGKKVIHTPPLA